MHTKNGRMAVIFIFICALLALASVLGQQVDEVASKDVTFTIEHRLSSGEFVPRTKIILVKKADGKQGLMFPEKNGIYEANGINEMKEILQTNSLYTIRLQSHFGNTSSEPILTSLPACELQKSGFKEDLTVYLDTKQSIIGVSYSSPTSAVARECDAKKIKDAVNFQTRIKLGDSIPIQWIPLKAVGARPPNFKDVKIEGESGTGAAPQQKTFFQRYWYIGLFMVIYVFIGKMNPPTEAAAAPAATASAAKKKD